jgi:fatty-acyl-CoA synthase
MFRLMFRRCNALDYDTRSVRVVVTAGEPASAELIREIAAAFPGAVVASSWGMTETSGFFTFTSLDDGTEIVAETEGRPDPAFEMKILGPDGQSLATGAVGELTVRGPSVMRSYMDPSDNAGVISDGWLRTGDLGYLDEAGYLHFAGRSKEMYISGGYNVYPLEIESYLNAYPGVNTSAVIAVPHEVWGEAGVAFVVPEDDAVLTAADLENYCREGLASYKRPGKICVAQNLPMSLIGKIAKRQLRESLAQYLHPDT